jgi:hypothetical protein
LGFKLPLDFGFHQLPRVIAHDLIMAHMRARSSADPRPPSGMSGHWGKVSCT